MAWLQLGRIFGVLGFSFAILCAFQNCADQHPTGTNAASTLSPGDIILLSRPADQTLYIGSNSTFEVQAESTHHLTLSYQWSKDGVALNGQTSSSLILTSVTNADAGTYSCKVSNSGDSNSVSANLTISPVPVLTINTQPQPVTLDEGVAGQLTVAASATPSQTLAYQWYKDGVAVSGGVAAVLNIVGTGSARSGNYNAKVTTTLGPLQMATSNSVKVTAQRTYNVNSATGCVNGYCACVTPGQGFVPYQPAAAAICVYKGYANVSTFTTAQGLDGARHCSADGSSCFTNAFNGNLVCASVTCIK